MKPKALILLLLIALPLLGSSCEVKAQETTRVLSSTIYQTWGQAPFSVSKGDYMVAGEVKNYGTEAQKFNLTATFYDSTGTILGTSYLSNSFPDAPACYLHVLMPNQKSPFLLWFSRFDQQGNFRVVDHYELILTTSQADNYHPSLKILSSSSHEAGSTLYVEGNIENLGSAIMQGLGVYVTYYSTNGDVVAVSAEGSSGLTSGQTTSFSVPLTGFNEGDRLEAIDRFEVVAEGYDYSLWNGEGQLISPEIVYILGTPEDATLPLHPEDPQDYTIFIIGAVIAIVVVAVVSFFLRSKKLEQQNS